MSQEKIAFWSTVAQISVVLALAMVASYPRLYSSKNRDRGWRSYKIGAVVGIISASISIATAMFSSVNALQAGHASVGSESAASTGLIIGFIVAVGWPATEPSLRVLSASPDPTKPEPPGLHQILWRLIRRKRTKPTPLRSDSDEAV